MHWSESLRQELLDLPQGSTIKIGDEFKYLTREVLRGWVGDAIDGIRIERHRDVVYLHKPHK